VTLKVTVQLPLAGIVIPPKLRLVELGFNVEGVMPMQVPPTAPPTALMFVSVSLNAALVRAMALPSDSVRVTTEVPPDWMEAGLNVFEMVGRAITFSVALALGAPGFGV
jgi:hypothetical protein